MTRVIQDSDDEFEEENLEENVEIPAVAPQSKDASRSVIDPTPTGEPGTGSTESLQRAIEAAHRSHFQSQFDPSVPTEALHHDILEPNALPPQGANKRRKTSESATPGRSSGTGPGNKRPLKTYGRSRTSLSSPFLEKSQGRSPHGDGENGMNTIWGLEGTIRDNYAQHEPIALLPEQSSTVPNATLTQQRLLEQVMGSDFLGLDPEPRHDDEPEAPHYEPQKSSVPWSDFLRTQSEDAEAESDPRSSHDKPSSGHGIDSQAEHEKHTLDIPIAMSQTPRRSQHGRQGSLFQPEASTLGNEIDPHELMDAHPSPSKRNVDDNLTNHHPSSSHPSQRVSSKSDAAIHDRPTPQDNKPNQAEGAPLPDSLETKRKSSPAPPSKDYSESIGLPKEQYKPRPSRSRSLKFNTQEPVDYSVRPEKAARKSFRRTKTISGSDTIAVAFTPSKVQQICDMGFTPSTTQRALEKNNGDVSQTVDWLLTNDFMDDRDELAPLPSTSKAGGRPRKSNAKAYPSAESEDATEEEVLLRAEEKGDITGHSNTDQTAETPHKATDPSEHKSPKVQVVIPNLKASITVRDVKDHSAGSRAPKKVDLADGPPSKRAKRRKTTHDQPEPLLEQHEISAPAPVQEKKRGRGRPKKEPVVVVAEDVTGKEGESEDSKETQTQPPGHEKVLQETQTRTTPNSDNLEPNRPGEETQATPNLALALPASTPPTKTVTTSVDAKRTPEKQTKPANAAQSSLIKGKGPYRVGLSKRARIAPLLRKVKK